MLEPKKDEENALKIEIFKVGPLATNCYVLTDKKTNKMAIIDPGGISSKLDEKLTQGGKCEYIILTHGHFDHIRKVNRYQNLTGAKVVANEDEINLIKDSGLNLSKDFCSRPIEEFKVDLALKNNDSIYLGDIEIKMLSTPGHTAGSACFMTSGLIFSGDTIMKSSIGRTDFKTGNSKDMIESVKKLAMLKDQYIIYPGHGEVTDLFSEKKNNPYFNLR